MNQTLPAGMARYTQLRQNIASFYPHLLASYENLVSVLGGPGILAPGDLEILSDLVLGTEQMLLDQRAVWVAWQRQELPAFAQALCSLHKTGPVSAGTFARLYPGLDHPLDAVHQAVLDFARSPAPKLDAKARLMAWAFAIPLPQDRHAFLTGFANVARDCPGIVEKVAANLDRHFSKRPVDDLKTWLFRGFSLVRGGRTEEASDFLCLQSRESRALLGLKGALLREEQDVLRIFTASLCSRGLGIQPVGISSFLLERPYTDGQGIYLPEEISTFADSELNRRTYTALAALLTQVTVQGTWGYDFSSAPFKYDLSDRFGSLLPQIATTLVMDYGRRIKSMRERRGNIMELLFKSGRPLVVLETDHERMFYSYPDPLFARKLFSILELSRAEAALSRRYEGLAKDFLRINAALVRTIPAVPPADPKSQEPEEKLKGMFLEVLRLMHLLRYGQTSPSLAALGGKAKTLAGTIAECFSQVRNPNATVDISAACTFKIYSELANAFPLQAFLGSGEVLIRWCSPLEPVLDPAIVADASPSLMHTKPSRPEFVPEEEDGAKSMDLTRMNEQEKKAKDLKEEIRSQAVRLYAYPEFDLPTNTYKPRHCMVYERQLEEGDAKYCDAIISSHRQIQNRMIKKFLSMQPEEVELTRRWYDGDEMHLGDAVDYATDLLRGASGDDRIYQRKTVNVRDVALQILVDTSSSTRIEVGGRKIIAIEKTSLLLLGSALNRIGDDFSIASYNSNGAEKVFFYLAKDFGEAWSKTVRSRIDSMEPSAANRDGCAIRHATARLNALNNKTKMLLILSDGIPADPGYGDSDGIQTSDYALEDTRRAILEARRSGIIPFCLTIDREAKDYIGHLYGDHSFSVLSDVNLLPQRLAKLYVRLTK